jgi:phosphomannomutase
MDTRCDVGLVFVCIFEPFLFWKVYWGNASQIIPPHDKGISSAINAHLVPWPLDVPSLLASSLVSCPTLSVAAAYYERIREWNFHSQQNSESAVKIVFTAMHGVGGKWAHKAFSAFRLPDFFPVMAQLFPDPAFPTVAFPNPEEGKGALRLAFACADRVGASLVIANDPDSDRLAVAEKSGKGWRVFSGNEVGTLLAWWTLSQYRAKVSPSSSFFFC